MPEGVSGREPLPRRLGAVPWRLAAPVVGLATFLLVLGGGAAAVGVHDAALTQAGLGVTIGSVALLAIAVLFGVASYQLFRMGRPASWEGGLRPACSPLVLVALLVVILAGVYAFFSSIGTASSQRPVVVGAALLGIAAALYGLHVFGRDARVTLPRIGTLALGLIGTILGAWEFWYQHQYEPARAGRAVSLSVELQRIAQQPGYDVVRASIGYQDVGGRAVSVIGSTYTLTGSHVVRCARPASAKTVSGVFGGFLVDPQRTRYMSDAWEEQPASVLAAGKFVGDGKHLDPSVPASRDLVFYVPHGRYQLLRLRAQLFAIPASVQLSQRSLPQFTTYPDDHDLYEFWHVDDSSWQHDLLFGRERWVVMRYELVARPQAAAVSPDFRVTARFPDPTWSHGAPNEPTVQRLFAQPQPSDASEPFGDAELSVGEVGAPGPGDHVPPGCS
jgi:hypothetical protein